MSDPVVVVPKDQSRCSTPQNTDPILNDPWTGPVQHWRLSNVTGETVETDEPLPGRRASGADERVIAGRNANPVDQTRCGRAPHPLINDLRRHVDAWRQAGRPGVTGPMARLLERWLPRYELRATPRPQPDEVLPYWCQVEAVETVIWLLEAGQSAAPDAWAKAQQEIAEANRRYNEGINRISVKMATGTGKTWVMAMLIAWWSETPAAGEQPQVLVIAPNTTVRDRLAVLRDPKDFMWTGILGPNGALRRRPRIEIINEQRWFRRRDVYGVAGGKPDGEALKYLRPAQTSEERAGRDESDADVADRLLRGFTPAQPILVLNDEGHHCWRTGADGRRKRRAPAGEWLDDAEDRDTAGRWFGILTALQRVGRLGPVIDLSATPFWRNPPEDADSALFPWTVSNTPLIEAIECGLVKIPVVPTRDDARGATKVERVFYRDTYRAIQDADAVGKRHPIHLKRSPSLPAKLDQLIEWMVHHYQKVAHERGVAGEPPPVLIVVTDTIDNANAIWRRIGGRFHPEGASAGIIPLLSNVQDGRPRSDAPTLLVHSKLDNGASEGNAECLKQVEAFFPRPVEKAGPRAGRPVGLDGYKKHIRLIRDTAGVPGAPGRNVRCVVSVLQLSEGWDCKGVSHVIGFRPFESQLLCEQTSGRALRRTTPYRNADESGPQYAIITGIPFRGMRAVKSEPPPERPEWVVGRLDERASLDICFPVVIGYRLERPTDNVTLPERLPPYELVVASSVAPTKTLAQDVLMEHGKPTGMSTTIETATRARVRSAVYELASRTADLLQRDVEQDDPTRKGRLFAQLVPLVERWLSLQSLMPKTRADVDGLLTEPHASAVPRRIAADCVMADGRPGGPVPVFDRTAPADGRGTAGFRTRLKYRYPTGDDARTRKSVLDRAACHSASETLVAAALDRHPDVEAWVRNYKLGWTIPWYNPATTRMHDYEPDFVARLCRDWPSDPEDLLVIEFKGAADTDAPRKRDTLEQWWTRGLNRSAAPGGTLWTPVWITEEGLIGNELDAAVAAARRRRVEHAT